MAFSGTVTSDFLKLVGVEDSIKESLVSYSDNDFLSLRTKLIDYIKAVYPLDYQAFIESDLGMMLIELVSYMGAMNSLKADLLVNENFIRTAQRRDSIGKLLELIGVRLKGPIPAAANAKITFTAPPATSPDDVLTVDPEDRVVQISSPEDGGPLIYTLYKVNNNGSVDVPNADVSLTFSESEADNYTTSATGSEFTNFVLLEGAFVVDSGLFTTTEGIKTIRLSQSPVVEGSVEVVIQGDSTTSGAYTQVDNIYFASGSGDKVYQTNTDSNFVATVLFGDGNLGLSPKVGDTYTITYRVGGGSRGNIGEEIINVPLSVTNSTAATTVTTTLENISVGTGGQDAETIEHAKKYAPLTFRRQDRLVTLQDYKTFANTYMSQYGSIGKATAITRRAGPQANIVDVYVLENASDTQLRAATPAFKIQLLEAMNLKKMLTTDINIVDGLIRTLDVNIVVRVDRELIPIEDEIKLKARNKVLEYFNVQNNDFGKAFSRADLIRKIIEVNEITFAELPNLPDLIRIDSNEIIQLNNLSISIVAI